MFISLRCLDIHPYKTDVAQNKMVSTLKTSHTFIADTLMVQYVPTFAVIRVIDLSKVLHKLVFSGRHKAAEIKDAMWSLREIEKEFGANPFPNTE